jgi:lysophospholipase L1-like esterase
MTKWFLALMAAVVCASGLAGCTSPTSQAASPPALRVLPLGDSITWGAGAPDTSGYRAELYRQVTDGGHALDFVGSQRSGSLSDDDHEGYPGWRIDEIHGIAGCIVAGYRPNIVTLHIGTNDMVQDHELLTAAARLGSLVDQILTSAPETTVLVSNLVLSTDPVLDARVQAYNAQVPAIVSIRKNAGKHVQLVDMSAVTGSDMADALHPDANGYVKMATAWNRGIDEVLSYGWVGEPVAAPGVDGCAGSAIVGGGADEASATTGG